MRPAIPQAMQAAVEHHQAGRLAQAEAIYRQILQVAPSHPDALHLLGLIAHQAGKHEIAVELIGKAIGVYPSSSTYHSNLGLALKDQGKLDEAIDSYRKALELKPDLAETYYNLGNAFQDQGKLDAAIESYRKALALKPDYAEAYNNLGYALQEQGKLDEAVGHYHRALALKPDFAETHINIGRVFQLQGKLEEAVDRFHRAISIKPDYAEAHNNLGLVLQEQGKIDAAVESYHRAISIKPDYLATHSSLLYLYAFTRHISPELECTLAANWEHVALNDSERTAAHDRRFSLNGSIDHFSRAGRRLRVGVVSAQICQHPVAEFLEPLLEQLDRGRFHTTLFSTASLSDSRSTRIRALADEFKSLVGFSDSKAADQIRSDRIDILIDTTGHMGGCRLGIFAHRAAPVQCHYIGYHGTTGLTEMDWFIADEEILPSGYDAHFREHIWRLPRLWCAYKGDVSLPETHWKPSSDGTVWLGSFNNLTKVREETLGLWGKVLNAIPESRLLLKDRKFADQTIQNRIRNELFRYGISEDRLEFAPWVPGWNPHMVLYDRLDIALDTIPFNSGTTGFDALWMGVPLVALEGNWWGGRMASTVLKALGKPEWVAQNETEYVAIVAALAKDIEGRKLLRTSQRSLMASSQLCDARGLARCLEKAFEAMFDQWLERQKKMPSLAS